jgi:hypothetical protein
MRQTACREKSVGDSIPEQDLWLIHRTRSDIMSGGMTRINTNFLN